MACIKSPVKLGDSTGLKSFFPHKLYFTGHVHGFTTPTSFMAQYRVPQHDSISLSHQSPWSVNDVLIISHFLLVLSNRVISPYFMPIGSTSAAAPNWLKSLWILTVCFHQCNNVICWYPSWFLVCDKAPDWLLGGRGRICVIQLPPMELVYIQKLFVSSL